MPDVGTFLFNHYLDLEPLATKKKKLIVAYDGDIVVSCTQIKVLLEKNQCVARSGDHCSDQLPHKKAQYNPTLTLYTGGV